MNIHPTPELQTKLDDLARCAGRDVETLAQEALERSPPYMIVYQVTGSAVLIVRILSSRQDGTSK